MKTEVETNKATKQVLVDSKVKLPKTQSELLVKTAIKVGPDIKPGRP